MALQLYISAAHPASRSASANSPIRVPASSASCTAAGRQYATRMSSPVAPISARFLGSMTDQIVQAVRYDLAHAAYLLHFSGEIGISVLMASLSLASAARFATSMLTTTKPASAPA